MRPLIAFVLLVAGCGSPSSGGKIPAPEAQVGALLHGPNEATPGGVPVRYAAWLRPDERSEASAQIDGAGVPPGWSVEVTIPVWESRDGSRLMTGVTDFDNKRIIVGWRALPYLLPLPALEHEVEHALHPEDICWGHNPGDPCTY